MKDDKMLSEEETIELRNKIDRIVRHAHMKDYDDAHTFCIGCVELAFEETLLGIFKILRRRKLIKFQVKGEKGSVKYQSQSSKLKSQLKGGNKKNANIKRSSD